MLCGACASTQQNKEGWHDHPIVMRWWSYHHAPRQAWQPEAEPRGSCRRPWQMARRGPPRCNLLPLNIGLGWICRLGCKFRDKRLAAYISVSNFFLLSTSTPSHLGPAFQTHSGLQNANLQSGVCRVCFKCASSRQRLFLQKVLQE